MAPVRCDDAAELRQQLQTGVASVILSAAATPAPLAEELARWCREALGTGPVTIFVLVERMPADAAAPSPLPDTLQCLADTDVTAIPRRVSTRELATLLRLASRCAACIPLSDLESGSGINPAKLPRDVKLAFYESMEQALLKSEERYRLAASATSDAIWDWNLLDDTIEWSERFGTLFGHELSRIVPTGNWWKSLIHPHDRRRVIASIHRAIDKGKEQWSEEYRFNCADGTFVDVLDRGTIIREADGTPVRMIGAMLDITERRRAERAMRESEQRFRTLAEAMPQIVWTAEPDGQVQYFNEQWFQFTGQTANDPQAMSWKPVLHPDDASESLLAWSQAVLEGRPLQIEHRLRRQDGAYRWHLARAVPMRNNAGRIIRWFGTTTDIHDQKITEQALKRSQDELKRLTESLEERVAERTAIAEQRAQQLRVMAAELTRAEQRERRRLAVVLHDHLQQLLVAATMKAGILRGRLSDNEDALNLLQQIKDLLSQSIASSRTLTVELSPPVLYDAGLGPALEWLARWMAEKHGLTVHVQCDTDAQALSEDVLAFVFEAVRELLFNVVKHAQTDRADVCMSIDDDECVCLQVRDQGTGIGQDILRDAHLGSGEGFGLFNIRERLEVLGGSLHVTSEKGQGASITMTVPCDRVETTGSAPATIAEARSAKTAHRHPPDDPLQDDIIRVLLADDHQIVREGLIGLIQEQEGIHVIGEACDGQMAVDMALELKPDVVIMDVSMPHLNGIEATRRIMADAPAIRVIGLSMHERETMAAAMRAAGAAAYLPKGGPSEPLIAAIRGKVQWEKDSRSASTAHAEQPTT